MLARALEDYGIERIATVIPERSQGYGLTHDLVESMLERYEPDLVITVDCGISSKEETKLAKELLRSMENSI